MADPKYLRFISVWPDAIIETICSAEVHHIPDLLQRAFLPVASRGIAKINVRFVPSQAAPQLEDALGVANLAWPFDIHRFPQLNASEQRSYYLDQLREALVFAAEHYGRDKGKLDACCAQIRKDDHRAEWWWPTKSKANTSRSMKAGVLIEMSITTRLSVVFSDSADVEVARVPLTDLAAGGAMGVLEHVLGELTWCDDEAVQIVHANGRDYWRVNRKGDVVFVFPPADSDNAQGLFQLATLYAEGRYVRRDRDQAMELMRRSATLGYKHAQNFLKSKGESAGAG